MRIGILTLPLLHNYGGILQAYVLRTVLTRMGHEVCHVTLPPYIYERFPWYKALPAYAKRALQRYVLHNYPHREIRYERARRLEAPLVYRLTQGFVDRYVPVRVVERLTPDVAAGFDAFVVGSDQVWCPRYFHAPIEAAYLSFTAGLPLRRVAYAASFGTAAWEYTAEQTARCREALARFDGVSVREAEAVAAVREHFGIAARQVLDPTMLLSRADYEALTADGTADAAAAGGRADCEARGKAAAPAGRLFDYVLDERPEMRAMVNAIARRRGLRLMPGGWTADTDYTLPPEARVKPSVEAWLRAFGAADFVVTDSFHACVFSILYEKPFAVVGNKERGLARFHSLLSLFGLEDRLVSDPADLDRLGPIDFAPVRERLAALREASTDFLRTHLTPQA